MFWKRMFFLVLLACALSAILGFVSRVTNLDEKQADIIGAALLVLVVVFGTHYVFPSSKGKRVETLSDDSPAESPTEILTTSNDDGMLHRPTLSEEFRAFNWRRKVISYFGFLDVDVYKNAVDIFSSPATASEDIKGDDRDGW
jgi:hypothetical protein